VSWISIEGLRVTYGDRVALDGIDLQIPRGSLVAVLGPSGCGKTTLLRALAGLVPAAGGTIRVGDRLISSATMQLAPEKRGMGWVPQDASLFPHLTVGQNIGFGLPRRGAVTERIAELAALVGLGDQIDRAPSQLSGGQAQRVALVRALAARPDLVLLDEPFAALDPLLRTALRVEVADLLHAQANTSLLVTHDQEEALSLADHVAVMRNGRILQWGTPRDVYERPATAWVAGFVGDIVEFHGVWAGGMVDSILGRLKAEAMSAVSDGDPVQLVLRPEWVQLSPVASNALGASDGSVAGVAATVASIAYAGHDALVTLALDSGSTVRARVAAPNLPQRGDRAQVSVSHPALAYAIGPS
jgi:iron(III) transport system ATP-binding protein